MKYVYVVTKVSESYYDYADNDEIVAICTSMKNALEFIGIDDESEYTIDKWLLNKRDALIDWESYNVNWSEVALPYCPICKSSECDHFNTTIREQNG